MKMSDVFELPIASAHSGVMIEPSGVVQGTYLNAKQGEAAIHAINNHDQLVEALSKLYTACVEDEQIDDMLDAQLFDAREVLNKVKGQL